MSNTHEFNFLCYIEKNTEHFTFNFLPSTQENKKESAVDMGRKAVSRLSLTSCTAQSDETRTRT